MKVILLEDIPKMGKKWEVKNVAEGFARNYLFPRGLAKAATTQLIKEAEERQQTKVSEAEADLLAEEALASKLDGIELEIPAKVSEKGELYSAVSQAKIAEALGVLGHQVDKKRIKIPEPVKQVGEHRVTVGLKHGLEAEIKVVVTEESRS